MSYLKPRLTGLLGARPLGKDNLKCPCKLILTSFLALLTTAHQPKMGTTTAKLVK